MPRRRLREHFVGVVFTFSFASRCGALFGKPTCALSSGGFGIDIGDEDGSVAVERVRLASVVARVVIIFREIREVRSRGESARAVTPISVMLGAVGETLELVCQ
eukprot:5295640-Pleurochrysis_carterae.AAC.1